MKSLLTKMSALILVFVLSMVIVFIIGVITGYVGIAVAIIVITTLNIIVLVYKSKELAKPIIASVKRLKLLAEGDLHSEAEVSKSDIWGRV